MEFIAKMSLTRQELFTFSNNEEKNWCMDNTGSEVQATPGRQSVHSLVLGPNLASWTRVSVMGSRNSWAGRQGTLVPVVVWSVMCLHVQ